MSDKRIRVLNIVNQMNRGGMENRLMDLYRHIDRKCIQFDFYTCREEEGYYDEEIKSLGGKVYYSKDLNVRNLLFLPDRFKSFFLSHRQYKIVHCHMNQWCGVILLGAKRANVPVRIAHSRTSLDSYKFKNIIKNIIKIPVNYAATEKLAVSKKAGEWLYGKRRVNNNEVKVLPNAIDCYSFLFSENRRKEYRKKLNIENNFVIVHVGNLKPEKNHFFLMKVFCDYLKVNVNARLMLVGAGGLKEKIEEKAETLGISESVFLLGQRADIPEILSAADCFVFPSFYEGFPGAVLEAQAAGLPCVISDTITPEVKLLSTTVMLPVDNDTLQWVNAVERISKKIITNQDRIKANKKIRQAGYDINALSRRYEKLYIKLKDNSKKEGGIAD